MSETPESAAVNAPAETQEAHQPELCFGEIETPNEMQLEMCFEADETPAATPTVTQNETQVDPQREKQPEMQTGTRVETPFEPQPEARVELQGETPIVTQDQTPVVTQIETQTETLIEVQAETRIEKQSDTPIETPVVTQTVAQVDAQTETRVEIERVETERVATESEKPTEARVVTRPGPQSVTLSDRPFRVKLRGSVLVLIRLPNKRQLRAALHQLSTTGGVINLEKPLDEKIEVEVIFHIDRSTIRGKAQMLFPMWATQGWMQPFRFVELTDTDRNALQENLQVFIGNLAKGASAAG
jgi:hypothetical protein